MCEAAGVSVAPGIPGELFDYVDAVPGLLDALEGDPTIDEFNAVIAGAASDGRLPAVVADHITAWNQFKRDDPAYLLAYGVFAEENQHRWEAEGLPAPAPALEFFDGDGRTGLPVVSNKIGRNTPCPCGSGRKYKHCHGGGHPPD